MLSPHAVWTSEDIIQLKSDIGKSTCVGAIYFFACPRHKGVSISISEKWRPVSYHLKVQHPLIWQNIIDARRSMKGGVEFSKITRILPTISAPASPAESSNQ